MHLIQHSERTLWSTQNARASKERSDIKNARYPALRRHQQGEKGRVSTEITSPNESTLEKIVIIIIIIITIEKISTVVQI